MKEAVGFGSELFYENDVNGSYLVLKPEGQSLYPHQVAMLMNGSNPALLPFNHRERDGLPYLYYEITSKQPLQMVLYRKKLKQQELLTILLAVVQALITSSTYLLYYQNYLLDENYIYIDPSTLEIRMVYLPYEWVQANSVTALKSLTNRLILALDPGEAVKDSFLHKILMAINEEQLQIKDFHRLLMALKLDMTTAEQDNSVKALKEEQQEIAAAKAIQSEMAVPPVSIKQSIVVQSQEEEKPGSQGEKKPKLIFLLSQIVLVVVTILLVTDTSLLKTDKGALDITALIGWTLLAIVLDVYLYKKLFWGEEKFQPKEKRKTKKKKSIIMNKKEIISKKAAEKEPLKGQQPMASMSPRPSMPIEQSFDTALIEISKQDYPQLTTITNGVAEYVDINKPSFVIGKLKEQVDMVIMDRAVSRIHAEITYAEGGCLLRDLNSKNGTYVNGERINSNVNYPIYNEDRIRFANREYTLVLNDN